jgi:GTP-binding protein
MNIVIVGRPNVGKSTLFNRLINKKLSIVSEIQGTTRDYREFETSIADLKFKITDLAGFEFNFKDELIKSINNMIYDQIKKANLIIMMFDANIGISSEDIRISKFLKKYNKLVILLGNKSEKLNSKYNVSEGWSLGFGEPIPFSAVHGIGVDELYERIKKEVKRPILNSDEKIEGNNSSKKSSIKITFIGKPNTGKSTLINRLLGYNRMITSSLSGTTHDSIEMDFVWKNYEFKIVDTAGMRKKSKIKEELEYKFVGSSLQAIKLTNIAVLVLDSSEELNKQDLSIARWVIEEGRALILCLNKWDLIQEKQKTFNKLLSRLNRSLPNMTHSKILNRRLQTSALNNWFGKVLEEHPPPMSGGKRIKLQYISQVKSRPPTFIIFCNNPDGLPDSYIRYLKSKLRENFNFEGVPLRINLRKKKNPYI